MRVIVSTNNGTSEQVAADERHAAIFLEMALAEKDSGPVTIIVVRDKPITEVPC